MCVGLARTIYVRCMYGIFGRETTIHTVIYGVYVRFWPTLLIYSYQGGLWQMRVALSAGGRSTVSARRICTVMAAHRLSNSSAFVVWEHIGHLPTVQQIVHVLCKAHVLDLHRQCDPELSGRLE